MNNRSFTAGLLALIVPLNAGAGRAQSGWTDVAPPAAEFSALAPGVPKPNPNKPAHYEHAVGDTSFFVEAQPQDDVARRMVASGHVPTLTTFLEAMRDATLRALKGTALASSFGDFDGHPSILFSFDGELANRPFVGGERIVLTEERMYLVVAVGPKGELTKADVDRFVGSFRLLKGVPALTATAPSAAGGAFRTIRFTDALCDRIPPVPITFEMPADFVSRRAAASSEAGCLWGTKDDLDRVTADPDAGDFSALRRGVFRARISTNVVNSPQTGAFDRMDGTGEAGIRRELEGAGARIAIFKKETLAGLPALQVVADAGGDRVYMLYLGNTHYISNTLLVNYYHPQKRSAADDELWARFVAGIKATPPRQ